MMLPLQMVVVHCYEQVAQLSDVVKPESCMAQILVPSLDGKYVLAVTTEIFK
jgi:hypothetical protein